MVYGVTRIRCARAREASSSVRKHVPAVVNRCRQASTINALPVAEASAPAKVMASIAMQTCSRIVLADPSLERKIANAAARSCLQVRRMLVRHAVEAAFAQPKVMVFIAMAMFSRIAPVDPSPGRKVANAAARSCLPVRRMLARRVAAAIIARVKTTGPIAMVVS